MAASGSYSGNSGYGTAGSTKPGYSPSASSRYAGGAARHPSRGSYLTNLQDAPVPLNRSTDASKAKPEYGALLSKGILYHSELVSMVLSGQSASLYAKTVDLYSPLSALPQAKKGWYESVRNPLESMHHGGHLFGNNLESRLPGTNSKKFGFYEHLPDYQPLPFFGGGGLGGGNMQLNPSDPSQQTLFFCPLCGNPQILCACKRK